MICLVTLFVLRRVYSKGLIIMMGKSWSAMWVNRTHQGIDVVSSFPNVSSQHFSDANRTQVEKCTKIDGHFLHISCYEIA